MSHPPPVDLDRFRAEMREAGIEEVVEPVVATWLDEAPRMYATLSGAVASGRLDEIASAAHALKSPSGQLHAHALTRALQELETAASRGEAAELASLFARVEASFHEAHAHVEEVSAR